MTSSTASRIAVWGLAFKPKTDDIREAPAIVLIKQLLQLGASVVVYDPEAMENVRKEELGDSVDYVERAMEALDGAHALAINTEWDMFRHPDFDEMKSRMETSVIFDGRNLYDPKLMKERGFTYYSIGRPPTINETLVEA